MNRLKQLEIKLQELKEKKKALILPINKKIASVTQMIYRERK